MSISAHFKRTFYSVYSCTQLYSTILEKSHASGKLYGTHRMGFRFCLFRTTQRMLKDAKVISHIFVIHHLFLSCSLSGKFSAAGENRPASQ